MNTSVKIDRNKQKIVGITGKAGSGKDTIADYLVKEYGFKKIALADPIKRLVKDVFVLDDHTVYDRLAREQPLSQWKDFSVRKLLQMIGTELFRRNIDDEVWVKSLWFRIRNDPDSSYIISDIRFMNEMSYFKRNCPSFSSIKVCRAGFDGKVGIKGHESEAYDLDADFLIQNNGTFESLYCQIDKILEKLTIVGETK